MVRIDPCHGSDPGSIPGSFVFFLIMYVIFFFFKTILLCTFQLLRPWKSFTARTDHRLPLYGLDPSGTQIPVLDDLAQLLPHTNRKICMIYV